MERQNDKYTCYDIVRTLIEIHKMRLFKWLKRNKVASKFEAERKLQRIIQHWTEESEDVVFDAACTEKALQHMRNVLSYYSRFNYFTDSEMNLEATRQYMIDIGLLQPCADDIGYLRNLKHVSKKRRLSVEYSNSDFV